MLNQRFPAFVASLLYLGFLVRNIRRRKPLIEHVIFTAFYAYVVAVVTVTLFPMPVTPRELAFLKIGGFEPKHNLIPFRNLSLLFKDRYGFYIMSRQLVGNTLLLLPLGFYLPLRNASARLSQACLMGLAASASIEMTQLLISTIIGYNYRSFDVNDLIFNTIGCVLGYACFNWIYPHLPESIKVTVSHLDRSAKGTSRPQTGS